MANYTSKISLEKVIKSICFSNILLKLTMTTFPVIVNFSGEFKAPFKSCSNPPIGLSSGKDGGFFSVSSLTSTILVYAITDDVVA